MEGLPKTESDVDVLEEPVADATKDIEAEVESWTPKAPEEETVDALPDIEAEIASWKQPKKTIGKKKSVESEVETTKKVDSLKRHSKEISKIADKQKEQKNKRLWRLTLVFIQLAGVLAGKEIKDIPVVSDFMDSFLPEIKHVDAHQDTATTATKNDYTEQAPQTGGTGELLVDNKTESSFTKEESDMIGFISQETGVNAAAVILGANNIKTVEGRLDALGHENKDTTKFENIEKACSQLTNEDWNILYKECMPRGFSCTKVEYVDKKVDSQSAYGINKKTDGMEVAAYFDPSTRKIVFTKFMQELDPGTDMRCFFHELAHTLDPKFNKYFTQHERLELQTKLISRMKSSDHFKSGYVESIKNDNQEVRETLKAGEYFAEIASYYFSAPDLLTSEDTEIVKSVIDKVDPDFNIKFARTMIREVRDRAIYRESEGKDGATVKRITDDINTQILEHHNQHEQK